MELIFKVLITYIVGSFVAGMALMTFDVATDFRHQLVVPASLLCLPPLGLIALFVVGFVLAAVWG